METSVYCICPSIASSVTILAWSCRFAGMGPPVSKFEFSSFTLTSMDQEKQPPPLLLQAAQLLLKDNPGQSSGPSVIWSETSSNVMESCVCGATFLLDQHLDRVTKTDTDSSRYGLCLRRVAALLLRLAYLMVDAQG